MFFGLSVWVCNHSSVTSIISEQWNLQVIQWFFIHSSLLFTAGWIWNVLNRSECPYTVKGSGNKTNAFILSLRGRVHLVCKISPGLYAVGMNISFLFNIYLNLSDSEWIHLCKHCLHRFITFIHCLFFVPWSVIRVFILVSIGVHVSINGNGQR